MKYTPFDGSTKPFTIGLKPMDLDTWLEVDETLEAYLAEKDRLYAERPDKVFVERADTRAGQQEVLDLIADSLEQNHAVTHRRDEDLMRIGTRTVSLAGADAPLKIASHLVQEDLVLMRKDHDGWRLVAASLCFPSSWSLTEKYDRALDDIHQPVPQFARGTRMAELIARMFDKLSPANPVERMNWSLQGNAVLYHPHTHASRIDRADGKLREFSPIETAARSFVRVERQTLRKLPVSGDILFTIRIYLDPLARIAAHADGGAVAGGFAEQLMAMNDDQLRYKGLKQDLDRLVDALRFISRN